MTPTDLHREIMERNEGREWDMDHEATKEVFGDSPRLWWVICALVLACFLRIVYAGGLG